MSGNDFWSAKKEGTIRLAKAMVYLLYVYRDNMDAIWQKLKPLKPETPWPLLSSSEAVVSWVLREGRKNPANTARTFFFICMGSPYSVNVLSDAVLHGELREGLAELYAKAKDYRELEMAILETFPQLKMVDADDGTWEQMEYHPQNPNLTLKAFRKIAGSAIFDMLPSAPELDGVFDVAFTEALLEVRDGHFEGLSLHDRAKAATLLGVSRQRINQMIQEGKLEIDADDGITFKSLYSIAQRKATPLLLHLFECEKGIWVPDAWVEGESEED